MTGTHSLTGWLGPLPVSVLSAARQKMRLSTMEGTAGKITGRYAAISHVLIHLFIDFREKHVPPKHPGRAFNCANHTVNKLAKSRTWLTLTASVSQYWEPLRRLCHNTVNPYGVCVTVLWTLTASVSQYWEPLRRLCYNTENPYGVCVTILRTLTVSVSQYCEPLRRLCHNTENPNGVCVTILRTLTASVSQYCEPLRRLCHSIVNPYGVCVTILWPPSFLPMSQLCAQIKGLSCKSRKRKKFNA